MRQALAAVRAMADVLGIDPLSPQWNRTGEEDLRPVVDALVGVALEQRQAARARKDYAAADAIRDSLAEAGILVEDTRRAPLGTETRLTSQRARPSCGVRRAQSGADKIRGSRGFVSVPSR